MNNESQKSCMYLRYPMIKGQHRSSSALINQTPSLNHPRMALLNNFPLSQTPETSNNPTSHLTNRPFPSPLPVNVNNPTSPNFSQARAATSRPQSCTAPPGNTLATPNAVTVDKWVRARETREVYVS